EAIADADTRPAQPLRQQRRKKEFSHIAPARQRIPAGGADLRVTRRAEEAAGERLDQFDRAVAEMAGIVGQRVAVVEADPAERGRRVPTMPAISATARSNWSRRSPAASSA